MFTRIYRVTILATGLNNELAEDIPESSSVLKDEEDYQRIIDKLYHPIRDNFQTLANKTEQKQEAESIDNINPDATEKEATIAIKKKCQEMSLEMSLEKSQLRF